MPRRALAVGLAAATALAAFSTTHAGAAAPQTGERRVCAAPAAGSFACDAHVRTKGAAPDATTTYVNGFSAAQIEKAYGLTGLTGSTLVAVVDAYASPNAKADLDEYRRVMGLPAASYTQVNQTGGTTMPAGDVGWGQEQMLDLEMVSAVCPTCPILYVGGNSSSFADLGAAVATAEAKGARIVSNSYGAAEFNGELTYAGNYDTPGVIYTVSSGDSGYGVQVPAAYKTVVAVGGTSLTLNPDGSRKAETVWNGAGSGCSAYVGKPGWQKDNATCSKRTVADVSAVADPATGVAVNDSYGATGGASWLVFGGTSVAAPIIAGVYGLKGVTSTTSAATLYAAQGSSSLYDVTSGSNGRCVKGSRTSTAYLCTGVQGYDGPTGVGTPNGTGAF